MFSAFDVQCKPVPHAGNGLIATVGVEAAKEILHIDRPLAYTLDSPRLQDTCANCLQSASQHDDISSEKVKLKRCTGCKIVKYCGEVCQRESFRLGHRYECKIFSALYPHVLPNTVRLVLRLLLRRQNRSLGDRDWSAFLSLQSHVTEFQAQQTKNAESLTVWQTIELMSQAAAKYSGTQEHLSNIQGMIARVLVNTHTLTTPTFDPLGLCLSPQSALLNHSCTPNSYIVFSGQKLALRSFNPMEAGTELTIAYTDNTQVTEKRKSELQARYFFSCTCPSCSAGTTNGMPDPTTDSAFLHIEDRALDLQLEATKLPPTEAGTRLKAALELLNNYPVSRQPFPIIQHNAFLNAIARQDWLQALRYALKAYFLIEPVQYPLSWHPARVVRKWVLLRLVVQIAGLLQDRDGSVEELRRFEVDWRVVIEGLWGEVRDGVELSHGGGNAFVEEVRAMGLQMGVGGGGIGETDLRREWVKLRVIASMI